MLPQESILAVFCEPFVGGKASSYLVLHLRRNLLDAHLICARALCNGKGL